MLRPESIADKVISGESLTLDEAVQLALLRGTDILALFLAASRVRDHFVGSEIELCSIINAKSGRCPENCAFCAQSAHHNAAVSVYPLVDEEALVSGARAAEQAGSNCYGIVTSGTTIDKGEELERICRAVQRMKTTTSISPSCSLGIIDYETACCLKAAGVETYHHNLETARSFFHAICTTHDYEQDVETVRAAKRAGLKVCCGGILGLGETVVQRIELALTIRELEVDSIPLNFLNPVSGTRLAGAAHLTPMECLKSIALFRLLLPDRKITVCGGREYNLRDLQSWMFFAGANGTMIGHYLTTTGRNTDLDWQMLRDLELTARSCCE